MSVISQNIYLEVHLNLNFLKECLDPLAGERHRFAEYYHILEHDVQPLSPRIAGTRFLQKWL